MRREQFKMGLIEFGIGLIIYISSFELLNLLSSSGTTELFVFLIRIVSYILIIIGIITSIMELVPYDKKFRIGKKSKIEKKEKNKIDK